MTFRTLPMPSLFTHANTENNTGVAADRPGSPGPVLHAVVCKDEPNVG